MRYIFLLAFLAVSAVHLYGSYRKRPELRAKTKGFIVFTLILFYLTSVPSPDFMTTAALSASLLGDVLLIKKGARWFVAGGIFFMISHVFFSLAYRQNIDFSLLPKAFVIGTAVLYFAAAVIIFRVLKGRVPKKLFVPMFGYLVINSGMNLFALMQSSLYGAQRHSLRLSERFCSSFPTQCCSLCISIGRTKSRRAIFRSCSATFPRNF